MSVCLSVCLNSFLCWKLAEAMYAKEQGGANPEAKKADDDDVIDAEVE